MSLTAEKLITAAPGTVEGKVFSPGDLDHLAIDKEDLKLAEQGGEEFVPTLVTAGVHYLDDGTVHTDETIIVSGEDAALHLLPMRDDKQPAVTLRSLFLATGLAAFQAVMSQIYSFKPTAVTVTGTFIVLIAYFLGNGWAALFPRGDRIAARFHERNGADAPRTFLVKLAVLVNPGPWSLKEHAICAITATSASNGAASITVFTAQKLFYDLPLSATTVVLSTMSIGLFGYGLCGLLRPITVWHVDAVYWSNLPTVKTLQGLHWQSLKSSKPIRVFWYAFSGMFIYEFFPAYIFPFLNSVSIPCLAAMKATGDKADTLTRFFGGSLNNEGLGLFNLSFDWQYITSFNTSLPLVLQANAAVGYFVCFIAMIIIYYGDIWGAKSLPFMSTRLRLASGGAYPVAKVFTGGVLNHEAFATYGVPKLTGSFAFAMFMANAAIGALIMHVIVFWGKDIIKTFKNARAGDAGDRHHEYMKDNYREAPWYWYVAILVISFVLGLVVVVKEKITLTWWQYFIALALGCLVAPFSCILYSRFGNGIATNNLSKMIGGLLIPEKPVGNMYFAAWSHNVIVNTVNLSGDLKMGEYLKISPRVMFLTQVWGTVFGSFINYVVMVSIVNNQRDLLVDSNGSSAWSGATIQSYNTNATSWALAKYLYKGGAQYSIVPYGLVIGAGLVVAHRIFVKFVPKIRGFATIDLNLPQFIQYAGFIPYNASQTCVIFSQIIAGFFVQFYLRNYKPRLFKDYSYLVTGAFDGASLLALFVLSFAVLGAGGPSTPFPQWWGNNQAGNLDLCPTSD